MKREHVPPLSTLSPTEARIWDMRVTSLLTRNSEPIHKSEDLQIPASGRKIPIRVYNPSTRNIQGVILYFHGGGWVLGNLDQVDYPCRLLANKTGTIVVSVGYRLAPECKFPGPLEDCYEATKWVAENIRKLGVDTERLIVCGDSAGGNLAAAVSLMAKDRGGPVIANQILIYPVVDLSDHNYQDLPDELSPGLTRDDMNWFIKHYISREEDLKNQYASPILRTDLSGLPPVLLITAEYDILTNQCNAYAAKLREAGVRVHTKHYPGLIHGFFTLPDAFDAAKESIKQTADELSSSV